MHAELIAALDDDGPWPTQRSTRTDPTTIVDVDIAGDYAAVLAVTVEAEFHNELALSEMVFSRGPDGWSGHGGGSSTTGEDPLLERTRSDPDVPLTIRGSGSCSIEPWTGRGRSVNHAQVLCSSQVVRVEIEREGARRVADVSQGPGWIVVVWGGDAEAAVTAFDADGRAIGELRPDTHLKEAEARHRARRRLR